MSATVAPLPRVACMVWKQCQCLSCCLPRMRLQLQCQSCILPVAIVFEVAALSLKNHCCSYCVSS